MGNEPGGVPLRIKHLLHSSAVRYGEIFDSPSAREISHHQSLDPSRRGVKIRNPLVGLGVRKFPIVTSSGYSMGVTLLTMIYTTPKSLHCKKTGVITLHEIFYINGNNSGYKGI